MPNDCWNNIIIIRHGDDNSEELTELFDKEIKAKNPPDDCLIIDYKGNNGIKFKLWSAWRPDNEWLEGLIQKYPNCWIKNYWYEEGGGAGIFIGGCLYGEPQETMIQEWVEVPIEGYSQYFGGIDAVYDRYGFKTIER